ncbi:MAG: type IV pilus secretin PilQ family protein [Betaproteobacteria bacterium]|nr:type IV pilus secretin PilQ family protein [Betaproteobacteria bacterium]
MRSAQRFAILALGLIAAQVALAQNSIESFHVTQQGGQVLVRVGLKNPIETAPASFTIAAPARIAFDFPKTSNSLGRNRQDIGEGDLRSMNLVEVGDRARLVLNLRNLVQYESKVEGKNLLVTLTAAAAPAAAAGSRFAEGRADATHALKDINFRRGRGGEGRIVVDLSDTSTGIDIRQQGQTIIVDFIKTTMPDSLRKRLDVVDFATPVQSISTFPQGENVRMVIEPRGLWDHNAYQTDTQFVVEVKPVQYDQNKLVQGTRAGYQGEKLSLNFQNVEVRSVLNVIADFTDLNIITSDTVQGNLTLRLKDVPWDQALDIILQTRGLDMRKNGNVVWIAPRDELATKEKLALEAQQQITELEPVRTETFQLNYAKAEVVARMLGDEKQRMLSKRGSVVVDGRTNQLFVQDVGTRLDDVRKLIVKLDVSVRQVLIEARIVEANDTFSKNLGAKLGYLDASLAVGDRPGSTFGILGGSRVNMTGNYQGIGEQSSPNVQISGGSFVPNTQFVNLPAGGIGGFTAGSLAISLFNKSLTKFINLELSALEADGKGKIISSPRVMTADNVEAVIEQGTELPYQQATSSGATSIVFRKANLSLKVKPQITPDGNIVMALDINKDAVGQVTTQGFAIDTKHVKTEVLIENGGTVVIGGIYTQDTRTTNTKVPLFGDLPVVGNLFKNQSRQDNKTELLVFITPRLVLERMGQR